MSTEPAPEHHPFDFLDCETHVSRAAHEKARSLAEARLIVASKGRTADPIPTATPLSAAEEAELRAWGGAQPTPSDTHAYLIARLLATLDAARQPVVDGVLDVERLARAMRPVWFEDVTSVRPSTLTDHEWGQLVGNVHQRRADAMREAERIVTEYARLGGLDDHS